MPEIPKAKNGAAFRYAELHCVSNFSFLRGASHPDELVARAGDLGYEALAITDASSLAGIVRAHVAAKEKKLKLLVGAEIALEDAATVVLLAKDREGYGRLARLLTLGRRRAHKGACLLRAADLVAAAAATATATAGWVVLGIADEAALRPKAGAEALARAAERLRWIREAFGDDAALACALHDGPDDRARLDRLLRLAATTGLPLVATGAVDAHDPERRPLRDTLVAIHHGVTVAELGSRLPPDGVRPLRSRATLARLYRGREELLERAAELAARCSFSLDELRYEYPVEGGQDELRRLVEIGVRERWPGGVAVKVRALIEHEMKLIAELGYERYFLTVHELVAFARGRGILCQGRGSAANSAVCYALGVTSVDPDRFDVLFERFVSKDRNEPPDIDIDFEHERREEVLQHVYERYGRERAALTATVITYRGRSAIREVGKALGLSLDQVDRLAHTIEWWDGAEWPADRLREAGFDPDDVALGRIVAIAHAIQGFPRHLSQHVGGMVITAGRLDTMVPIENAAMENRTVIQWDKDDLDSLGILKVDCLALGMLSAIRKTFDLVKAARGRDLSLATIPAEDPAVYAMIQDADTIGVFQIESRAQMAMLPRLKPACFYDLVIEVAIVRPGPIQGGMVHPYLRRREGREEVSYPSEAVRSVLEKTLGVPIFQEQAMRLAVVAAGFTPGEADQLRRAMGAWRRPGLIQTFGERLIRGMLERGYTQEFAQALFKQLQGFGEYGFPESHAASFALLTYVSCWLKRHEPAAFTTALLNSQPMGFYAPAQLVRDAREHGVEVRPVDIRASVFDCTLEAPSEVVARADAARAVRAGWKNLAYLGGGVRSPAPAPAPTPLRRQECRRSFGKNGPSLRLGFRMLKGFSEAAALRIVAARAGRPFTSVEDCRRRARLDAREARILADAGAFAGIAEHRRAASWDAALPRDDAPLFAALPPVDEARPTLEAPDFAETIAADYRLCGLSLAGHPMSLLREVARRRGARPASALAVTKDRTIVTVAGIVINRQRPATASGILFMTLEDETGYINLIVFPKEQDRHRNLVLNSRLLLVTGRLERQGQVTHVLVTRLADLSDRLAAIPTASRDFH